MSEKSTAASDEELVRRAQNGDRRAFGELVPRYGLVVHAMCTGMAGTANAAELSHEAFVEAWLKIQSRCRRAATDAGVRRRRHTSSARDPSLF